MIDEKPNKFYAIKKHDDDGYGLKALGKSQFRGAFAIGDYSEIMDSPTTSDDYDNAFYDKITDLKPVYDIPILLEHHYQSTSRQNEEFLNHIEFVILPMFRNKGREEYFELITKWIKSRKDTMLKEQLKRKNEFLLKAYEAAMNHAPNSPLSVSVNPRGLGESIGYDSNEVERIMMELVDDGYVSSSLGMGDLFIKNRGLNYLRMIELGPEPSPAQNNVFINSPGANAISHSSGFTVNQQFGKIAETLNQIEQVVRKEKGLDDNKLTEILECIEEIRDGLNQGKKPKFALKQLLETGSNVASIASLLATLAAA